MHRQKPEPMNDAQKTIVLNRFAPVAKPSDAVAPPRRSDDVGQPEPSPMDADLDDLRAENERLRATAAQMHEEMMSLYRALDARPAPPPAPEPSVAEPTPSLSQTGESDEALVWKLLPEDVVLLRAHAKNLSEELQAVHASLSWQITKPLRILVRMLGIK